LILESVVLGGELVQVGRKEEHRGRRDGEFGTLGAHGSTGDTDDISSSEKSVKSFEIGRGFGFTVLAKFVMSNQVSLSSNFTEITQMRAKRVVNLRGVCHDLNLLTFRV
jgi:hypothetical protein